MWRPDRELFWPLLMDDDMVYFWGDPEGVAGLDYEECVRKLYEAVLVEIINEKQPRTKKDEIRETTVELNIRNQK